MANTMYLGKHIFTVLSRAEANEFAKQTHDQRISAICIYETWNSDPDVPYESNVMNGVKNVLHIHFDDCEADKENNENVICITKEQAKEIVDFFYKVKDDTDWFVINCYAGMSRSAGCCAAIMRMMYNEDSPVFNNGFFTPNMKVYRMILNAWLDRIAEDAEKQNTVAWRKENEEILEDNENDCDY